MRQVRAASPHPRAHKNMRKRVREREGTGAQKHGASRRARAARHVVQRHPVLLDRLIVVVRLRLAALGRGGALLEVDVAHVRAELPGLVEPLRVADDRVVDSEGVGVELV